MKILLAILISILTMSLVLLLSGCGNVSVKQNPDGSFEFNSRTLWKDIEAAEFQSDDFVGSVGSSTNADDARSLAALCILFPQSDACR